MATTVRESEATKADTKGQGPSSALQESLQKLAGTLADQALSSVSDKVTSASGRLTDYAEGGGGPGLLAAVTGSQKLAEGKSPLSSALGGGLAGVKETVKQKAGDLKDAVTGGGKGKGKGKKLKITNIVEQIDVGVPRQLAYDQWTQFADFPQFMKKLEQVEQIEDEKLRWQAKVFWSRRAWESTIVEQVPYERIIWRSKGDKGYVDGAVTFHELTPDLTRIVVVLEYHPKGLFEKTGNIWRAQGRRMRLELKHFQRHVMTQTALHPKEIEGWHGEIRDSEVVEDDETARKREAEEAEEAERDEGTPGYDEEPDEEEELEEEEEEPDEEEPDEDEEPAESDLDEEVEEPEAEEPERPRRRARTRRSESESARPASRKRGARA